MRVQVLQELQREVHAMQTAELVDIAHLFKLGRKSFEICAPIRALRLRADMGHLCYLELTNTANAFFRKVMWGRLTGQPVCMSENKPIVRSRRAPPRPTTACFMRPVPMRRLHETCAARRPGDQKVAFLEQGGNPRLAGQG